MPVQRHFQNAVLKNISNRTGLRWSSHIKTVLSFGIQFGLQMGSLEMVSLPRSCVRHEPNTIILYAGQRQIKLDYDGHAWLGMSHLIIWGIFGLNANAWSGHLNRCVEIDGVRGDENIAELFANKYQDIYNSHHVNDSELRELRSVIESRLQTEDSISISYIKLDEVTDAIKQLNANKSDGNYGLYSNHLLLSSFHFDEHLAKLFTCMLHHGHHLYYILDAVISLIPKNSNSSDYYRRIVLSSALGKV